MLFTQQVFHLCLFSLISFCTCDSYYFESNLGLVLLMKVLFTKNVCNVVLQSSKPEEITFPPGIMFVFMPYFIGAI